MTPCSSSKLLIEQPIRPIFWLKTCHSLIYALGKFRHKCELPVYLRLLAFTVPVDCEDSRMACFLEYSQLTFDVLQFYR